MDDVARLLDQKDALIRVLQDALEIANASLHDLAVTVDDLAARVAALEAAWEATPPDDRPR